MMPDADIVINTMRVIKVKDRMSEKPLRGITFRIFFGELKFIMQGLSDLQKRFFFVVLKMSRAYS